MLMAYVCSMLIVGFSLAQQLSTTQETRPYRQLDEYEDLPFSAERVRLDNLADILQDEPDVQGYIVVYAGRRAHIGEAQARATRAKNYLISRRCIEAERIITIDGGYREELTVELHLVPRGRPAPRAAPTVAPNEVQIIRDGSTRRNNRRSSRPHHN